MATERRDISLVKEKAAKSPSQTVTTKLKPTPNQPTKPNDVSVISKGQIPSNHRPTTKSSMPTVVTKKPASKPTNPRPKTLSPTRVSTNVSVRGKTIDSPKLVAGKNLNSQKPVPSKNLKTPAKEVGKQRILHPSTSNVKRSSSNMKKEESRSGFSTRNEKITTSEKIENLSIPSVPEVKTQVEDQDSCIAQSDEKVVKVNVEGVDVVMDDQEPLDIEKNEEKIDQTDGKIAIFEPWTNLEHENSTFHTKRQDLEDLEEQGAQEINSCNNGENVAEEKVEELAKEQETTLKKKDDMENRSDANKSKTEGQKSEHTGSKQVGRPLRKKDSVVSNDVIEETASKLREQRKNRVRALAGAFETVISLQEK